MLSGEGFTASVTLPADDTPSAEGMRLRHIGPLLDGVASLNNAIPVVSADKVVSVVARDLVTGDLVLDDTNTELLRVEDSRQNYRTSQVTRGGDLLRTEVFVGRADGRYRLGGPQNLNPAISLFDVLAIGEGVEWIDERARPLSGPRESILILRADAVEWPVSVVPAGDRAVHELTLNSEGLILRGPTVPADTTAGLAVRASDGSEWGWSLSGLSSRTGTLLSLDGLGDDLYVIGLNPFSYQLVGSLPTDIRNSGARGITSHNGELLLADRHVTNNVLIGGRLWRINPDNPSDQSGIYGLLGEFPGMFNSPQALASHGGELFGVQNLNTGNRSLWRINPDNPSDQSGIYGLLGEFPPGLDDPTGLVSHEGRLLCSSGGSAGWLWNVNPDNPLDISGDYGRIAGALPSNSPAGLASREGELLLSGNNRIWNINPDNPSDTSGDYGSIGQVFQFPQGLAYYGGGSVIPLSSLGIANVADMESIVAKLRIGDSKLVLVDTSAPRVDLPNRVLLATGDIIEVEATGIHTLNVGGVETDVGGVGSTWSWSEALQEVQEAPASDPPPMGVNIRYRGRWICRESNGMVPRVERVSIRKDLALPEDGRRFGREQLDAHGRIKETLIADLITGFGTVVPEGSGVTISQALIVRVPQLVGLTPADVLRVERVEMSAPDEGDLIQQTLRLLRRADESRYRDDWRRTLLERVGTD